MPYEVGVSRYRELARGQIAGDSYGMLKLLVSTDDLTLLGVHIFGSNATEMVHIGQAVMGCEARWSIWSMRCSTTRRSPRPTRSPRST